MKALPVLAALSCGALAATTTTAAAKCNADNCARAVTGTLRAATASQFADCKSFQACTVTPAAVTVTTYSTVTPAAITTTIIAGPNNGARDLNGRAVASSVPSSAVTNCPSAVPSYASACAGVVRYASACLCFGAAPTTTTIATPTITVTGFTTLAAPLATVTVAPPGCDNAGLEWAQYPDSQIGFYDYYDPTVHKTQTPTNQGVTNYLFWAQNYGGGASAGPYYDAPDTGPYGGPKIPADYVALDHRGYLYTPEAGTYTFRTPHNDEVLFMWLGPLAYSGWQRGNENQWAYLAEWEGVHTYTITLEAGKYYPLRVLWKNWILDADFRYEIISPSGKQLIGYSKDGATNSSSIVRFSCDGTSAPRYPPFGQET